MALAQDPPDGSSPEAPEQRELPTTTPPPQSVIPTAPVSGGALTGLSRRLTDKELSTPGAIKLLVERVDLAEMECQDLRDRVDFERSRHDSLVATLHAAEIKSAVLEEKLRFNRINELLTGAVLTAGGILIGAATLVQQGWLQVVLAGVGVILFAAGALGRCLFK